MKSSTTCLYLLTIYLTTVSAGLEARGATAGKKKLLCWTNTEGVRECGDRLPPEYAQEGHEILNKSGRVVDEKERAKTDEEIEEERIQAEILAQQAKAEQEQAKKDRMLLDTFSDVNEIEVARDSKVASLDNSISAAEKRGARMQESLDSRVNVAAAAEREGKTPPAPLLKDIESLKRQIKENDDFIHNAMKEKETVTTVYNSDIERYKELTSNQQ